MVNFFQDLYMELAMMIKKCASVQDHFTGIKKKILSIFARCQDNAYKMRKVKTSTKKVIKNDIYEISVSLCIAFKKSNLRNWYFCTENLLRRKFVTALNGAVQNFVSFLRHRISLSKFSKFCLSWSTWDLSKCIKFRFTGKL